MIDLSRFYCDSFGGAYNPFNILGEFSTTQDELDADVNVNYRTPFQDINAAEAEAIFDTIIAKGN